MLADGNYIFGGKQAVVYTELEICYTHETNVINQCYISKKLKIHENSSKKKEKGRIWLGNSLKYSYMPSAVPSSLFSTLFPNISRVPFKCYAVNLTLLSLWSKIQCLLFLRTHQYLRNNRQHAVGPQVSS